MFTSFVWLVCRYLSLSFCPSWNVGEPQVVVALSEHDRSVKHNILSWLQTNLITSIIWAGVVKPMNYDQSFTWLDYGGLSLGGPIKTVGAESQYLYKGGTDGWKLSKPPQFITLEVSRSPPTMFVQYTDNKQQWVWQSHPYVCPLKQSRPYRCGRTPDACRWCYRGDFKWTYLLNRRPLMSVCDLVL